jgi:glutaredoxin
MKQAIITTIFITVIIGLLAVIITGSKAKNNNSDLETNLVVENSTKQLKPVTANIFYWGTTCPYCHDVIDWMEENKIEEQVQVIRKEVYNNRANSLELTQAAKNCGLPTDNIGVPFLYNTDKQCFIGAPDIIANLSKQVVEQEQQIEASESAERIRNE